MKNVNPSSKTNKRNMFLSVKSKIIVALLGLALLLLMANVGAELFKKKETRPKPLIDESVVREKIVQILDSYNIEPNWRREIFSRKKSKGTNILGLRVKVPGDLLLPFFVRDILWEFRREPKLKDLIKINVSKSKSKTVFRFASGGKNIFLLELIPEPNLKRKHTEIALVIKFPSDVENDEIEKYLPYHYRLTLLLRPSQKLLKMKEEIMRTGKDYALLLDDGIEDDSYVIRSGYSRAQLSNVVASMVNDFNDCVAIFYDTGSSLFKSPVFSFVKENFAKRKRKLIPLSRLHYLHGNDEVEIISRFKFFERSGLGAGKRRLLINKENFDVLLKYLPEYFKKGNLLSKF